MLTKLFSKVGACVLSPELRRSLHLCHEASVNGTLDQVIGRRSTRKECPKAKVRALA